MIGNGHIQFIADPVFRDVEAIIRAKSKTFTFATALLPDVQRRAVRALYGFCRFTDDLVDEQKVTLEELDEWRQSVNLPAEKQQEPVLRAWSITREFFGIDRRFQEELIDGVAMDLVNLSYQTWDQLSRYCYLVASTVGLLSIPIIGLKPGTTEEQARPFAIKLGIALQLTNILRDVGEDARAGRVYLPEEDLVAFNLTRADILNGVYDQRFFALMGFEIERARRLYIESLPGIAMLSSSARPAVGVAALLYRAILDEIETIQYQVYRIRAHTTFWKKIKMLPGLIREVKNIEEHASEPLHG